MMFLVMGVSLLIASVAFLPAALRTVRFWVIISDCVAIFFALGLIAEGFERMGWTS